MKKTPNLVKNIHLLFFALAALALTMPVKALVFYGATATGGPGELYILDPATGAVIQDIGPLNDSLGTNYGITGLAFHPATGILYGSTADNVTATRRKLVTINPSNGLVTVVGLYNANTSTMADIAFDSSGNLWGIGSAGGARLYSININTGQATLIGASGISGTGGGGLAISSAGVFYSTPNVSLFGTFNPVTGAYSNIANPTKPVGGGYPALAFDGSGVLYGLNGGPGTAGNPSEIVTIDPTTGAVTDIAPSIPKLDAIAFQPTPQAIVISASASIATANEQGPVNGRFTITRTGDSTGSLVVPYTIIGTATPGIDYVALSGSVTLQAGATSTNIAVQVIDDAVAEFTETVVLTVNPDPAYGIGVASATVSILDNEPTEASVALASAENRLLEGYSDSKVGFQLQRRGLISSNFTANLAYSGTAALGSRFNGPSTVSVGTNVAAVNFNITSINDEIFQGSQSAIVSVTSGSGYSVGASNSATATVIDDDYPSGTVLFIDDFETNSAARWIVNSNTTDSGADFAYDFSQLYVPAAPGTVTTKGLRFHLNELTGAPKNAISASPLGLNLDGDYRLKFQMWINYNGPMLDGGSGSTFHLTAGVGTTADHANLATSAASDGIWFGVDGDGGATTTGIGDADAYVATDLQTSDSGVYAAGTNNTTSPYFSLWGNLSAPAAQLAHFSGQTGVSQRGNMGVSWHTVVLTKATNTVTWVIDGILIATIPADATSLSSNVFVGFQDLFTGAASVPAMCFGIIDNLRVETFSATQAITPIITGIQIVGTNVVINFTGGAGDSASSFSVVSATNVDDVFVPVAPAASMSGSGGVFQATLSKPGATTQFYRISR